MCGGRLRDKTRLGTRHTLESKQAGQGMVVSSTSCILPFTHTWKSSLFHKTCIKVNERNKSQLSRSDMYLERLNIACASVQVYTKSAT